MADESAVQQRVGANRVWGALSRSKAQHQVERRATGLTLRCALCPGEFLAVEFEGAELDWSAVLERMNAFLARHDHALPFFHGEGCACTLCDRQLRTRLEALVKEWGEAGATTEVKAEALAKLATEQQDHELGAQAVALGAMAGAIKGAAKRLGAVMAGEGGG